jgi:hypothetical protein
MQTILLPGGRLLVQDQSGAVYEIGMEHPDYQRFMAYRQPPAKRSLVPARLFGLLMMLGGIGGWWYNWHLAETQAQFYIRLCILGPLGLFGGFMLLVRPDWIGPLRKDSPRSQKMALIAVIALMAVISGIDMYRLQHIRKPQRAVTAWTPAMGTPAVGLTAGFSAPDISLLGRTYRLGSFQQKQNATWEFIPADENIANWKTMLTIVDRPDARTREDLDRLSEGIMANFKSHGGQILLAKTMRDAAGEPFNYMVAAFDEPAGRRIELNFVRMMMGRGNAAVMIYAVRITDPADYRSAAKNFLDRRSSEVGRALGGMSLPEIDRLPRHEAKRSAS